MLCTHCQTPNPDGAPTCLQCHQNLDESGATLAPSAAAGLTATPTIAPARATPLRASSGPGLSRRTPSSSLASFSGLSTLPEGFEIGHRYRVAKLLGRGGMGAVYRCHDLELDRDVALKLIRPEIAEDPATLDRFRREIQLSSRVTHRNVLRVYDLGEVEGIRFLTMQYVDGDDLASLIKREGRLPLPRVLSIFGEICKGLSAAHEQGVVHRDLKPQNIMLDAAGTAYVTDFGLARSLAGTGMTELGAILGTPFYMSPEQVKGEKAGPASDIYSLGVILYEMVTGVVPFTGDSAYQVMMRRLSHKPKPAADLNPEVPAFLQKIIERCLALDPAARYPSVDEVLADLATGTFSTNVRFELLQKRWVLMAAAAVVVAGLAFGGVFWLLKRRPAAAPAEAPKAQSILIADFENRTGDPVFSGTLESAFGISLEGASFVTTFSRASARKVAVQLQPGTEGLPDAVARLVAVREGVQVVASGSVASAGSGYVVEVRAVDAVTGRVIETVKVQAAGKDAVLGAIAKAAAAVRTSLGDSTPASLQLAAAETYSAGSIAAAHEYAQAQELQWAGKWDDAGRTYARAAEMDPNMGRAWAGLAAVYANQGKASESEKAYREAMARIDRMSDREKYRTRGAYYIVMRQPEKAIEQLEQLVKLYPADTAGMANLALAEFYRRDMPRALAEGRRAIQIYPKNVIQRNNVALYAMYAGEFDTALKESAAVLAMNPAFPKAFVAQALSEAALGRREDAASTYRKLEATGARGASYASMGLADLALVEGRPADAVPLLLAGSAADLEGKSAEAAGAKLAALADAQLAMGKSADALASAERALAASRNLSVAFPVARVYLAAGREPKALALADELGARLEPDAQAYARLIRGEAKLHRGKAREAVADFEEAKKIADTWLGRYDLGRAYVELGAFTEAHTELEACVKRRGEATAVFLDDVPSWRYFPPALHALGRAQEGIKSPAAADSFKAFLAIRGNAAGDPLVADARRRLKETK
ncbi:MAG TPA: protein kinase [Thermoanaerobaculia bacterium]|jgi:tetratricopeptide (TPR) repeat protein/TolB-like protein